jgi:hypothetical protein
MAALAEAARANARPIENAFILTIDTIFDGNLFRVLFIHDKQDIGTWSKDRYPESRFPRQFVKRIIGYGIAMKPKFFTKI